MELVDLLAALFPSGHNVAVTDGIIAGTAPLPSGGIAHVMGVAERQPLGIEIALALAVRVMTAIASDDRAPIVLLIDSASQRMSRREELLGLNEYLAHLAKTLLLAEREGHPTLALLYGGSAAGAFIVTALAAARLVALPTSTPEVMDLPSMSRVTKLPLERLTMMAKDTPVFAPGPDNLRCMGAIEVMAEPDIPLDLQLAAWLGEETSNIDQRAGSGAARGGRVRAQAVTDRVVAQAQAHG